MGTAPRIVAQGIDGFVIRLSDRLTPDANRATLALRAAIDAAHFDTVRETSTALASVYVRITPDADPEAAEAALREILATQRPADPPLPQDRRRWTIPAVFGGDRAPGFAAAAAQAGLAPEAAVADLTAAPLRVLAIGFAPGQPYLGELSPAWDLPRLPDLVDVPAAALVVAIRQLVLFANPSPTGWQHVAQTAFRCFRPEAEAEGGDPFPLRPGDEVAIRPIGEAEFRDIEDAPDGGATCEAVG